MGARLQHVALPYAVGQEAALREFYTGVLGLPEKKVPDALAGRSFIWFEAGEGGLELHFLPDVPPDLAPARHFCLEVDDVAATRAQLEASGAWLRDATAIPGRPRVFTCDPAGNLLELTTIEADYRELEAP